MGDLAAKLGGYEAASDLKETGALVPADNSHPSAAWTGNGNLSPDLKSDGRDILESTSLKIRHY